MSGFLLTRQVSNFAPFLFITEFDRMLSFKLLCYINVLQILLVKAYSWYFLFTLFTFCSLVGLIGLFTLKDILWKLFYHSMNKSHLHVTALLCSRQKGHEHVHCISTNVKHTLHGTIQSILSTFEQTNQNDEVPSPPYVS